MDKVRVRVSRAVLLLSTGIVILTVAVAWAIVTELGTVDAVHDPVAVHADQGELNALNAQDAHAAFEEAFELGDELFATQFNALDGGGANVGRGQRFTRVPRADLNGPTEWKSHTPFRVTGPNAQGCFECHEQPFEDGSGTAALNVHRDPFRTGIDRPVHRTQHAARLRAGRHPAAGRGDDGRSHRRSEPARCRRLRRRRCDAVGDPGGQRDQLRNPGRAADQRFLPELHGRQYHLRRHRRAGDRQSSRPPTTRRPAYS